MSQIPLKTLVLIMTNAGGEGKSTWAEMLAAMASFAGRDVVVADVDPGNRGYRNRNGDGSANGSDGSAWCRPSVASNQVDEPAVVVVSSDM